jgi:hypothetical protein
VSWLRRLSVRYDTPARDLLRGAGAVKPITGTTQVISRLRNNRGLLRRLGLDPIETSRLLTAAPLVGATLTYTQTFRQDSMPVRPWMRYCPPCLAGPDPIWPDHWRCPLSMICPVHGVYLLQTCPGCRQKPHATPAWLAHPVDLHRCPSRVHQHDASPGRRQLPWCDTDLSTAPTVSAPPEEVAGQRLLHRVRCVMGLADTVSLVGHGSDCLGEFGERCGDPQSGEGVDSEFVVAAAQILQEGVARDHDLRGPISL